ncbi:unnamed protein product [Calypogeia fissa]
MAATDVTAVSGAVIQIATAIQGFGNNWYKASADWDDFPRKLARLRRKQDFWHKEFKKSDMLSDSPLVATLHEAKALLEQEQASLKRRQARKGRWSKVSMTVFPAQVGLKIQHVIDAFDAIPGFLQMEEEAAAALERRMMRKPPTLPFPDDDRYVPLEVTEWKVQSALEVPHGSKVVLLHGGAGTGKSTSARHVALHYQRICGNPEAPFELVVFLECGPKADATTSQFRLLQILAPNSAVVVPPEQGQTISHVAMQRQLSGLLKSQRILIMLDDVRERRFLQEMLNLCGVGVKCLVTSQDRDLCHGLSLSHPAIQIQIEEVEDNIAMKILASHVGLAEKQIPAHIQVVAHQMIVATQGNPLALASVAVAIDHTRCDEIAQWEAASQNLLKLLQSSDTAYMLGVQYSRSFWSAIRFAIESLTKDAQNLLILLQMCEAPAVPEEVLQILYSSVGFQAGFDAFERSRKDLESKGLVKIIKDDLTQQRSWSVYSLQKMFIEDEMNDEKETSLKVCKERMLRMLASQADDTKIEAGDTNSTTSISFEEDNLVQLSLCALYFHEEYSRKTYSKIDVLVNERNNLRRTAIEPITRLLALPVSKGWTKAAQASAKQVFFKYIYNYVLHDTGIVDLLSLRIYRLSMLQTLDNIVTVEPQTTWVDETSGTLMKALLDFLKHTGDSNTAMTAARVLHELSRNKVHHGVILSSGILDTIVTNLSFESNSLLLVASTKILMQLISEDIESAVKIVQHPNIFTFLMKSLFKEDNPGLQEAAAMTLSKLEVVLEEFTDINYPGAALLNLEIVIDEFRQTVINWPRAFKWLVNMLSKDDDHPRQSVAARTFSLLAAEVPDMKQKIVDFPGALELIIRSISKGDSPHLQVHAAAALRNLTKNAPDVKEKLLVYPGALDQLLASMSRNSSPEFQVYVAQTLVGLAASDVAITKRKLVNFPGLLEQLVNLLSKNNRPDLQVEAANALVNLAANNPYGKQNIVACPGVVEQLLASMSRNDSPKLQLQATKGLASLTASDNESTKRKLLNFAGVLERLVNLLSKNESPDVQLQATKGLASLAASDNEATKQKLLNFPGVLEQLVNVLAMSNNREAQVEAARVLRNLAGDAAEVTQKIVEYPGALEQLVACMSRDDSPELQLEAAKALQGFTESDYDSTLRQLINFPGLLEQLVSMLSKDSNGDLQDAAVWTLARLAFRLVDETWLRMMHCSGLVEKLFGALTEDKCSQWCWECYVHALTFINPARANGVRLTSAGAYADRGIANLVLGLNKECLEDCNRAIEIQPGWVEALRDRGIVRTRLGDFQGALKDFNSVIEKDCIAWDFRERGVLKRLMADLPGALADLDEALKLELKPDSHYEILKQRGFVRFLMKNERGAHSDAERALTMEPCKVYQSAYGWKNLGTGPVEFLDYHIR